MNSTSFLKLLAQLLKAGSFFAALVGTANFVMTAMSGAWLNGLGSLGWGLFFAATLWGQAVLVNGMLQKTPEKT